MPNITRTVPRESPLHRRLLSEIGARMSFAERRRTDREKVWRQAEEQVIAYIPESEADAVRRSNREGNGKPAYTTIQIPYTYALLMAAHTYWSSVLFSRTPIHQFAGRHGETEQQTQALEALIAYQVDVGGFGGPYYTWLYDAGKYGVGILGTYWTEQLDQITEIAVMTDPVTGEEKTIQTSQRIPGYKGNKVCNVSPQDFYHDPRVTVGRFQEGEFCFNRQTITWNEVVKRRFAGYYMNTDEIKSSGGESGQFWDRGSDQLNRPDTVGDPTAGGADHDAASYGQNHPSTVRIVEFYIELIPKEWGLGGTDYPEKWVFTLTADKAVIIGAQPLGARHNKFPFDVLEIEPEAYGMYNRGIPETIQPIQNVMDWLINSHFYNVRASINNLFVVDPSKIMMKDLERPQPGGAIRLKPEALGTDVRTALYQVPITDVTRSNLNDLEAMQAIGERMTGINDQMLGAMGQGGRKSATEIRTSTGFGTNRLKTVTEYMSVTAFSPHAQKLVQNSQQYYDGEMKMRIVGDLAMEAGAGFMQVDPSMIGGYFDFVNVDGTLPIDRMAQATLWKDMLATSARDPRIAAGFDWVRIFAWVAQIAGLKNINQFRVQIMPDAQLAAQAQQGNVIPMKQPGGGVPAAGIAPPIPSQG